MPSINRLTAQDCYAVMNALVAQATGQSDISVVNTSTFVSAGNSVLATGYENTLNALSLVLGRTLVAVRPYKAKLASIQAMNSDVYSHRLRKISYFARNNLPAGDWNTSLFPENLYQGKTNAQDTTSGHESTKSMWVQNQPQVLEMNFSGSDVWQTSTTVYRYQLQQAFRSEEDFGQFVTGIMTEKANDIESTKEAFNRMAVVNKIAEVFDTGVSAQKINLTKAFNDKFNTNYTSAQLRSTYLKDFLKFFVAEFKKVSDRMTERSANFHMSVTKTVKNAETGNNETLYILRHTPKELQHALLYNPLFVEAQAEVMPEIFNPSYLNIDNFEGVDFWQSNYDEDARPAIKCTPAIFHDGAQEAGETVELPYVVGMIFDRDALVVDYQLDDASASPYESRKGFYNLWWSMARNICSDPTEQAVIFYMDDPAEGNLVGSAIVGSAEAGD